MKLAELPPLQKGDEILITIRGVKPFRATYDGYTHPWFEYTSAEGERSCILSGINNVEKTGQMAQAEVARVIESERGGPAFLVYWRREEIEPPDPSEGRILVCQHSDHCVKAKPDFAFWTGYGWNDQTGEKARFDFWMPMPEAWKP